MELSYSVVATTFNDENTVDRFISEITNQTITPKEIVIADGGSNDRTVEKLISLSKSNNIPIVILYGKRLNIAEGYNTAIKAASEEFIGITGLGNRYKKDYFEKLISKIENEKLDGAYSPIRGLDTTEFSKRYNLELLNGEIGQRMDIASNHGALIKKIVFEDLNFFYEKFVYAGEDTEFYFLVKNSRFHLEIVPDADVRWETPENFEEFKKQTRVYAIAGLQIDAKAQLNMILKHIVKLGLGVLYVVLLMMSLFSDINVTIKITDCLVTLIFLICFKKKFKLMKLYQMYLQIYYTLLNLKYGKKEYEVKR